VCHRFLCRRTSLLQDYLKFLQYLVYLYNYRPSCCMYVINYIVLMLILKVIQIHVLDEIKAWSNRQNGKGKFNVTNFIIFNLLWQTLLAGHFFFYNFIYYSQTDPCFGTLLLIKDFQITSTTAQPFTSLITNPPSSQSMRVCISLNSLSALSTCL
jgi:hypothetical protein